MLKIAYALAAVAMGFSCAGQSRPISNAIELKAALRASSGGETLELKPGRYEGLVLNKGVIPTKPVMVRAADPANPPVFTKPVVLRSVKNISFRNIRFQVDNAATKQPAVAVYDSSNIAFENSFFRGREDAAGRHGFGLFANGVEGLTVRQNRFMALDRAVVAARVRGLKAQLNDITNIGHDGFSLADISGEISGNLIEDFHPLPGFHPDGIQFHSNKQLAARDVLIQDNLIIARPDHRVQGIFMRGSYASDPSQRFRNIRIIGNIVAGSMWHGIMVGQADEIQITGNKVLHLPGIDRVTPWIMTKSATGRVMNNQAFKIVLNPEMVASNNARIGPSTPAQVAAIREEWLRRFRRGAR